MRISVWASLFVVAGLGLVGLAAVGIDDLVPTGGHAYPLSVAQARQRLLAAKWPADLNVGYGASVFSPRPDAVDFEIAGRKGAHIDYEVTLRALGPQRTSAEVALTDATGDVGERLRDKPALRRILDAAARELTAATLENRAFRESAIFVPYWLAVAAGEAPPRSRVPAPSPLR